MTLAERLADANQRSVALYLQRTRLQQQLQQMQMQAALCDQGLLKLDGEIELLEKMQADEQAAPRG